MPAQTARDRDGVVTAGNEYGRRGRGCGRPPALDSKLRAPPRRGAYLQTRVRPQRGAEAGSASGVESDHHRPQRIQTEFQGVVLNQGISGAEPRDDISGPCRHLETKVNDLPRFEPYVLAAKETAVDLKAKAAGSRLHAEVVHQHG